MAHAGLLRVLCGTVFVTSPAALLDRLTPGWMNGTFWAVVILIYYLPAAFMSAVSVTYILTASEGFRLGIRLSCILGAAVALGLFVMYLVLLRRAGRSNRQGNDTLS